MKRPSITQAHTLCDALNARSVIILAFSEDGFMAASYGATKLECQQTGFTLDRISEAIETGAIPVWASGCEAL